MVQISKCGCDCKNVVIFQVLLLWDGQSLLHLDTWITFNCGWRVYLTLCDASKQEHHEPHSSSYFQSESMSTEWLRMLSHQMIQRSLAWFLLSVFCHIFTFSGNIYMLVLFTHFKNITFYQWHFLTQMSVSPTLNHPACCSSWHIFMLFWTPGDLYCSHIDAFHIPGRGSSSNMWNKLKKNQ